MQPAIVLPFHDPDGVMFPHLEAILPLLEQNFQAAFLAVPEGTRQRHPENIRRLEGDPFFHLFFHADDLPVGSHFAFLYRQAAQASPADQILHLCFIDRLAFALQPEFRAQFLADVNSLRAADVPLIFQRSARAWQTHPKNYFEIETFITRMGSLLFDRELDFAWCHLAIRSDQLQALMPQVRQSDWRMVAEMILLLLKQLRTREVDWLAWEDPFVLGRAAAALKREREGSLAETRKRLAYALPMVELMTQFAQDQRG